MLFGIISSITSTVGAIKSSITATEAVVSTTAAAGAAYVGYDQYAKHNDASYLAAQIEKVEKRDREKEDKKAKKEADREAAKRAAQVNGVFAIFPEARDAVYNQFAGIFGKK